MKDRLNLWLSQSARLPGVLACGLQYADRTCFTQQWADDIEPGPLEKSLACTGDVWNLLRLHGISGKWLRWGYRDAWLFFTRRGDGVCLGLIAKRDSASTDLQPVIALLESFISDVQNLCVPHPAES